MGNKTVTLYPSPKNCQRTEDDEILFDIASAMLGQIAKQVPETERSTLRITGWQGLRLVYTHTPTEAERKDERLAILETALRAASRDGLTGEQTMQLLQRAGAA